MADKENFDHIPFLAFFGRIISHGLEECNKRPPCVKGAVCKADWGIDNPSGLSAVIHLPLREGSFADVRSRQIYESGVALDNNTCV